ncbi:MAG: nucleoside deaminase [Limnochordia bacterium]
MEKLQQLPEAWQACLDLAVEGYNAGSMGIAAVIVDKAGKIVARGRNQLRDDKDSCSSIRMSSVAHAEINALNNLPQEYREDRELTLYTTVEPCPMCLGAVAMSRIRAIKIGCADPHAGSIVMLEHNEYLRGKNIAVEYAGGEVEKLCFLLHYLSIRRDLSHNPGHRIFKALARRYPHYVQAIDAVLERDESLHRGDITTEFLYYASARLG